jgi:glutathione-independent formaldehyde dehydrogenase
MADQNRAVIYRGPRHVEVENVQDATVTLQHGPGVHPDNVGRELPHAVILKVVATNICGSDHGLVAAAA